MRLYPYLSLFSFVCLILFTACQKEAPIRTKRTLSPEAFLERNTTSPILFHIAYTNEITQEHKGWFIDRWGAIKSYTTSLQDPKAIPTEEQCGAHLLDNLYALANQTHSHIELTELVEQFKLIGKIKRQQLTPLQTQDSEEQLNFYAFDPEENYEGDTHCYDQNGNRVEVFNRLLLQADGQEKQVNTSVAAQAILTWLHDLQAQHQL